MSGPRSFRKSLYHRGCTGESRVDYYQDFARTELEINSFIVPAVLDGIVKNVYFIYPPWRLLTPTRKMLNICSAFGEGTVLKYNVSGMRGAPPWLRHEVMPDLTRFSYHAMEIERIPARRKVLLDIDLDYFACRDSAPWVVGYEVELTQEEYINRKIGTGCLFGTLETRFKEKNGRYYAEIGHRKGRELVHMPSPGEIEREIEKVAAALEQKNTVPIVITICRSCNSGYCPADYCSFIEDRLSRRLLSS